MLLVINIVLLALGTIGALAAFGGECWKKTDEPLRKRITLRGWVALPCLLAALGLGITKEVVSTRMAKAAAEEAARVQADLQAKLETAARVQTDLRAKLEKIPKAIDHPFYETIGGRDGVVYSSESQHPLVVYGGEIIEYQILGDGEKQPNSIVFEVGTRRYPLSSQTRSVQVIGVPGDAMPVRLVYPHGLTFSMKMTLMSAVRATTSSFGTPLSNSHEKPVLKK